MGTLLTHKREYLSFLDYRLEGHEQALVAGIPSKLHIHFSYLCFLVVARIFWSSFFLPVKHDTITMSNLFQPFSPLG